jgi:hypothetical protein
VCDKRDKNMQEAHEPRVTRAGGMIIENPNLRGSRTDLWKKLKAAFQA